MDIICQEKTDPTAIRSMYARGIETGIPILELLDNLEQTKIDGPGGFLFKIVRKQFRHLIGAICINKIINLHEYQLTIAVIIHKKGDSFGVHPVEKPPVELSS